jgi:hypothetical protein
VRNPTRRSKKIGLTQGGRVRNGRPVEKWSRHFPRNLWDELSQLTGPCRIIVENPSRNYFHPCVGAEYLNVLARLSGDACEIVRAIVLRRTSKRDERRTIEARKRFSCIILNSFPRSLESRWPPRPTEAQIRHFAPWCSTWKQADRGWLQVWTLDEIRRYYLYHLFLHEVGHFYQPWSHARRKREAFAENFALEWAERLGVLHSSALGGV